MELSHQLHYQQHQQAVDIHLIDGIQQQVDEQKDEMQVQHIHQQQVKHFMHSGLSKIFFIMVNFGQN
jgi:hypothetical protein